jgi:hypothetical protein
VALDRYLGLMEQLHWTETPDVLRRARALQRLMRQEPVDSVARDLNVGKRHLLRWLDTIQMDGFHGWLQKPEPTADTLKAAREGIAQMMQGFLAEQHFESLAVGALGPEGYRLEDQRVGRTDTDYRLMGPDGRPVFRLNVKFHGTLFARAREYVELDPADCFPLATYKIAAALKKQDEEGLPYLFLIISVPGFPREAVERSVSDDWAWLAAVSGRATEEAIVALLVKDHWVNPIRDEIARAQFRVISARRAYQQMEQHLFTRVHALRLRGFNRLFRGAEINMHLSLSQEMIGYEDLLDLLAQRGPAEVSVRLDRGQI